MSTNTNGILLVKSRVNTKKDWLEIFEMFNFPDKIETVDNEYTAISYYDDEGDSSIILKEEAKSLTEEPEVINVFLCEIAPDYGVYINLFENRKQTEIWVEDDGITGANNMNFSDSLNTLLFETFSSNFLSSSNYKTHLSTIHNLALNYKTPSEDENIAKNLNETPKFTYGKSFFSETAVIRLKINDDSIRKKITEVFSEAIGLKSKDEKNKFQNKFISLFDHEHKVKWCSLYDKYDNYWLNGPQKLLEGLRFVFEEDGSVYFGFDVTESIGSKKGIQYLESVENLIIIFGLIKGVSKLWLKARINENSTTEMYSIDPVAGYNHPLITEVPITSDSEWPPLDKKKSINQ